ncbi:MAG: hypothetical protein V4547_18195 [Bacteroidota bacterium]
MRQGLTERFALGIEAASFFVKKDKGESPLKRPKNKLTVVALPHIKNKNMNIYNPTAKKVGEDIVIEYYDTSEPSIKDYSGWYSSDYKSGAFKSAVVNWANSKKSAIFHKDTEQEFKNELVYIWKNTRINKLFNETLSTVGISLESIKDRLAFKVDCLKVCDGECIECEHMEKYFILKPEQKPESEDDIWGEIVRILDDNTRSLGTKIAYIRTKFTITRK